MKAENQPNLSGLTGAEYAAIAMALHEKFLCPHDKEANRLTIRAVSSAWSFKPCLMPDRPVLK